MLKRKQTRAIQKFIYSVFKQFWQLSRSASRKLSRWLVRNLLHKGYGKRSHATAKAGFVLPTVTVLLLVVALVVAAILFRTGSRTNQVMGEREQQVIYNAATPAIERAKAKLEYLFLKDTRLPSGPPSNEFLMSLLTNGLNPNYQLISTANPDPYLFPDEDDIRGVNGRLDLDGDGQVDPAWAYQTDVDGDGIKEIVVYSILLNTRNQSGNITLESSSDANKASALVVRNGPLNTINISDPVCSNLLTGSGSGTSSSTSPTSINPNHWYPAGSAVLRKTFQVDAIVISNKPGLKRTVTTLEFQQDRQLDKGNKWGAWFRYDLEVFPGSAFNWNGAMYSAGNIFVGSNDGSSKFRSFLISAQKSCFYTKDASEITIATLNADPPRQPNAYLGQIGVGRLSTNSYDSKAIFHVVNSDNSPNSTNGVEMDSGKDSVKDDKKPVDISLDPVALFTQDISKARTGTPPDNKLARDAGWDSNAGPGTIGYFQTRKRIYNKTEATPYVDDTYRADNRYGPKPRYDKTDITENGLAIPSSETKLIKDVVPPQDQEFKELGLDGYWERRARAEGLRIIVGERLQLGNTYGWVNSDLNANGNRNEPNEADPLYPPNQNPIKHEEQQRRTLRDNLAAVQATAVYHYKSGNSGYFPIAFVATTAHPGTGSNTTGTIGNSKKFNLNSSVYSYPDGTSAILYSDFFNGRGTDGWEYEVVAGGGEDENTFKGQLSAGQPLGKALRNLAYFAGEKDGAFPPTKQDRVYPHPYLTMWGNFSNLNRALSNLDSVGYDNLSIADKSYIHTAAGTLGMLANNISYFQGYTYNAADLENLNTALKTLDNASTSPGSTPDAYIDKVTDTTQKKIAQFVYQKEQIARDRLLGFAPSPSATSPTAPSGAEFRYEVKLHAVNPPTGSTTPKFKYAGVEYGNDVTTDTATQKKFVYVGCDLSDSGDGSGNNWFGMGNPNSWGTDVEKEKKFIRLAVSLCPTQPKYPSLFYIFPVATHSDRQTVNTSVNSSEEYIKKTTDRSIPNPPAGYVGFSPAEINLMALRPKGINFATGCGDTGWCLPTTNSIVPSTVPSKDDFAVIDPNGNQRWVSIIDNALFDGREMMNVRVLDIDLKQLKSVTFNGDTWLPANHGVVYAFREDAVREDAISRPSNGAYTNPNDTGHPRTNATNPNDPKDPALTSLKISPKPVDFYADPDRRPYGFRLRNGQVLKRDTGDQGYGIAFVSDNPVYIQGNFNFHSTDGNSNDLEEFKDILLKNDPNWNQFYNRQQLDDRFARPNKDTWRPAEIAADAIAILSDNFDAGSVEDGIKNDTSKKNSYRGFNGPNGDNVNPERGWIREDGTVSNTSLPIKLSRNGYPFFCPNSAPAPITGQPCTTPQEYKASYRQFGYAYGTSNVLDKASNTQVNATIVSGILPSQNKQSYGGLHNFPRMIEDWFDRDLNISGSFVQLSFSTYATGPYDQDDWEPDGADGANEPRSEEWNFYYNRPNRRWGYDVGLQYAPAGPLAQRFIQSASPRSEFYRDLEVSDPYICKLRRALNNRLPDIDLASRTECP
ncbi:hormogonium polysaccharide biosynthesis protein HpsA [Aerosakkonema funiforme]|uniref:Uncharacterized protein n=2 Tax=Oscillatoriophycideae TaxID=1301283 RepID=A0A926VIP1_9CYAN|nr:hormogonium polysaccharide biosynthesis protein HpsA [Aerosakkonema funiforme]MBD2184534.1 hypothetical protein [Aerosakkonema funiforme FACHB-1375]